MPLHPPALEVLPLRWEQIESKFPQVQQNENYLYWIYLNWDRLLSIGRSSHFSCVSLMFQSACFQLGVGIVASILLMLMLFQKVILIELKRTLVAR